MNDNLPPLPKPEALQRKQLSHGGYEMRPVFTPEQMREYGQLCRQQKLEEALKLLTDSQRMELFSQYCTSCGCNDPRCQCWNDE